MTKIEILQSVESFNELIGKTAHRVFELASDTQALGDDVRKDFIRYFGKELQEAIDKSENGRLHLDAEAAYIKIFAPEVLDDVQKLLDDMSEQLQAIKEKTSLVSKEFCMAVVNSDALN